MKKNLKYGLFIVALLLVGCGGDNSHSGEGIEGGGSSPAQGNALSSLQQNVFASHANGFVNNIDALLAQVNGVTTADANTVQSFKSGFSSIMQEWKSVETTYVAADFDSSLIDTPQFIDFFHTGKALDVAVDVQNALNGGGSIESALFKNSSKSITALEYMIFGNSESNAALATKMNTSSGRRIDAMKVSLNYLKGYAGDIASYYQSNFSFSENETDGANSIVNALIDSSFKLKEWRLGEPSGIANKFKDNPDATRLEYFKSGLSLVAIQAILRAHQDTMGERAYENFGSFSSANGAEAVVTSIRNQINDALNKVNSLNVPLETSVSNPQITALYNSVKELQRLYFENLIQALNLTAEIIEADGD